jgi:hypothetical protein
MLLNDVKADSFFTKIDSIERFFYQVNILSSYLDSLIGIGYEMEQDLWNHKLKHNQKIYDDKVVSFQMQLNQVKNKLIRFRDSSSDTTASQVAKELINLYINIKNFHLKIIRGMTKPSTNITDEEVDKSAKDEERFKSLIIQVNEYFKLQVDKFNKFLITRNMILNQSK